MSALRILRRKAWKKAVRTEGVDATFHDHQIATGQRHESYQSRIRKARKERGLPVTSSNMHTLDGGRT